MTTTASLADVLDEIAAALRPLADEIPGLQIVPYLNTNPTPPGLDVYPADPFQVGASFGVGQSLATFTVRARVSTADQQAGQLLLLRMLDPNDPASVEAALQDTAVIRNDNPVSGFREYVEDAAGNGRLIGCEWKVSRYL